MQKIGAISKLPNRYQQLSIIAFAICVSIRYGIIDYPLQRYAIFVKYGVCILLNEFYHFKVFFLFAIDCEFYECTHLLPALFAGGTGVYMQTIDKVVIFYL